jgi:CheY-like chemotaxis protein
MARSLLKRSILNHYSVEILLCENGREALRILEKECIDLLLLDLTMPVMDGYGVLASLPVNDYHTRVYVVSGDVQHEAKKRCLALGAAGFIEKPYKQSQLDQLFSQYMHVRPASETEHKPTAQPDTVVAPISKFKEVTNIALGRGAAILSERIGQFIEMPLPAVGVLEAGELNMAIADALQRESVYAVTQRFVGSGIHGEYLVCLYGRDIGPLGARLGLEMGSASQNELVLNIANLLVSTFMNSLAHQLVANFSLRQPIMLNASQQESLSGHATDRAAFCVEFTYKAESLDFTCEMLLLIDPDCEKVIYQLMEHL